MTDQERIKSLVKEAELYRTQGLLVESKEKYLEALQLIGKNQGFRSHKKLINTVKNKILSLEKGLAAIDQKTAPSEQSQRVQDLIKKLFSFSEDKEVAAIEGAVALAKFGQYERALAEFNRLLKKGALPLVAAKNIIRCHLAFSLADAAIDQFRQWLSGDLLSKQQLKNIRAFLQNVLKKKGIQAELPDVVEVSSETTENVEKQDGLLDISSVGVKLENGPRKGSVVELDVTFQSGNVISVMVSANEKDLVDSFKLGIRLRDIQFYYPTAIFTGSGVVSGKTEIDSGPNQGDYMLDITIDSA